MAEENQSKANNGEKPNTAANSSKDFFISYNDADKKWAEWIAWQLEEAGFSTILQAWDFRPGANFVLKMQEASKEAKRTIAVLSPNYLSADFTQSEWTAAFKRDSQGTKGTLVPVMVHDCRQELEGLWPQIIYINLVGLSEQEARKELLGGMNRSRNKPKTAPLFPGDIQHHKAEEPHFPGNPSSPLNTPQPPSILNENKLEKPLHLASTHQPPMALQLPPLPENKLEKSSHLASTHQPSVAPQLRPHPNHRKWLPVYLCLVLLVGGTGAWIILHLLLPQPPITPIIAPVSAQSIKLNPHESITIGMSDGSFRFPTQGELNSYALPREADGQTCIYDENKRILTNQPQVSYLTIVAVVSLSDTQADDTYSFGLGNATLQGFCQKQISYNSDPDHKVKVRILVANIGVQDADVLQKTMPIITQHLILLSQQDNTFIGAVGFPFSASLDDHNSGHTIDTMSQLKKADIPVISTTAAASTPKKAARASDPNFDTQWAGYFYRMNPGNEAEAEVSAYYAYHTQHKKTAFVFYDSSLDYSKSLGEEFIDNFQALGGRPTSLDMHSNNFTQPLPNLNIHPPDMIFCACVAASISPDFSILYRDLQQYPNLKDGIKDGKVMLMGADGLYNPEGRNIIYQNISFTTFAFPDTIYNICNSRPNARCSSEQLDFYKNYCERFDPQDYQKQPGLHPNTNCGTYGLSRPSKSTMLGYDALSTLLQAYDLVAPDNQSSASTSLRDNVRQKLPDVNFQGITGWIQLSKISSNPVHKMILVISVDGNGFGHTTDYCGNFTPAVSNYTLSPQQDC